VNLRLPFTFLTSVALVGCILVGNNPSSVLRIFGRIITQGLLFNSRFVFTWIAELAFGKISGVVRYTTQSDDRNNITDTVTFTLTLWRAIQASEWKREGTVSLLRIIIRDGTVFASVFVTCGAQRQRCHVLWYYIRRQCHHRRILYGQSVHCKNISSF